ncbi:MAG: hypothetical protein V7604_1575 [Hyphomicrobiales bacterium]
MSLLRGSSARFAVAGGAEPDDKTSVDGAASQPLSVRRPSTGNVMSLGTIILIILVIALLGGFSGIGGGPFYGTGYYGGGGLGLVIVILLILVLLGRL